MTSELNCRFTFDLVSKRNEFFECSITLPVQLDLKLFHTFKSHLKCQFYNDWIRRLYAHQPDLNFGYLFYDAESGFLTRIPIF